MWARISTLQSRRAAAQKCVGGAAALMIGLTSAASAAADDKFSLANAIPDDVFITAVQQHNPEREFLHKYWDEVWQTFKESGIIDDALELALTALDDEQRSEVNRIKDRFSDLITAGDWKAMVSGQTAFAERMPNAEQRGGNMIVGAPDFVVMFRTTDAVAQKNFKVLSGLLTAAVEEINSAADIQLQIDRTVRHGADLVTFNLTQKAHDAPPMPLSIGRRGDTILLTFGQGIRDEVVDLLAGKSADKSIADTPRFKQAFAQLGPAEDAITFFDMSNLRRGLESIADGIFKAIESEIDDDITNARENEEANELKNEGIAAYEKGDHDKALELTREAYEIAPNDSVIIYNLACLHALTRKQGRSPKLARESGRSGLPRAEENSRRRRPRQPAKRVALSGSAQERRAASRR